jgi:hypothetical protein
LSETNWLHLCEKVHVPSGLRFLHGRPPLKSGQGFLLDSSDFACAPVQGVQIDFTDATYNQASAVVKAAVYGHCSFAEASAILAERLDAAANIEAIEKIRGAMDSLKTAGETAVHSATGTFLFVWAKVSNVISKRADFTYKLEAAAKSKSAVHSVTLVRPETEAEFYEMTHLFIMTVIALGLASATIVIKFIDDVVFGTVRMREPFTVAHELVVCYFREMDFDPARVLHMGNVFRRGGQDTLLSEARRNAAAFFRAGGGILQPKGNNDDKLGNVKTIKNTKPNGRPTMASTTGRVNCIASSCVMEWATVGDDPNFFFSKISAFLVSSTTSGHAAAK